MRPARNARAFSIKESDSGGTRSGMNPFALAPLILRCARRAPIEKGSFMPRWFFEPGHTAAEFRARHMMVTWVRGHFKDVHGTMEFDPENLRATSVDVTIDARKIWTGEP